MIDELLADAEAVALTEQIHPGGSMDECMARAAWTVIAEPGDAVAGALIAELGAAEALAVAVGHSSSLLSPGSANAAASRMLADGRARWTPRAAPRAVLAALHGAAAAGVRLLIPGDAAWPAALDDLGPHVPAALWVRGRVELLDHQPRDWHVAELNLAL